MKKKLILLAVVSNLLWFSRCNQEDQLEGMDKVLYNKTVDSGNFQWYQTSALRPSNNLSAHNSFMRIRFNEMASSALGWDKRLPVDGSFPNGSLIVKELYNDSTGSLVLYAVMYKDSSSRYASNNWLWAQYSPDETVKVSVNKKGSSCTGCHNSGESRDFTRVFDLF